MRKSSRGTKLRGDCFITISTSRACVQISGAPPAPGQAHRRVRIVADDGGVEIAEAIDLRGAEEADVDAAALQVVGENLRQRHDAGGASSASSPSPIDSGSTAGRVPTVPDS